MTKASGAFDDLMFKVTSTCKTPFHAELATVTMIMIATAVTAINTVAIVIIGPIANRLFRSYKLDRCRGANLLDGLSCAVTGLIPYNATMMTLLSLAIASGAIPEDFSITSVIKFNFHCMMLVILFVGSVLTGIGRKMAKDGEE